MSAGGGGGEEGVRDAGCGVRGAGERVCRVLFSIIVGMSTRFGASSGGGE